MAPTSKAKTKVAKVMKEYKGGKLHSGSKKGPVVKSRQQAIAIAMSEAGMKKPAKKTASKMHSQKGEYKSAAAKKKHEAKETPRKKAMEKKMGRSS
jgi:hypothetical protein